MKNKSSKKMPQQKAAPKNISGTTPKTKRKLPILPIIPIMFILTYLWASWWYGDVFCTAREFSFWAPDNTLMYYMNGKSWQAMLVVGQFLLMFYKWKWLGALFIAFMLTGGSWLLGYNLRLPSSLRPLQYIPAGIYMAVVSYVGFDIYFEAETGLILGVPFVCFFTLAIIAIIIKSFSRKKVPAFFLRPKDETVLTNYLQLGVIAIFMAIAFGISEYLRPEVRIVTTMEQKMQEQDWNGMAETARSKPELSYRLIAAYYIISLVQQGQQCERLYDIRLDYDEPYVHDYQGGETNANSYYFMDCDLYAGLVEPAIHHAMEHMTMNGPSLRALKTLTKCALLRGEWIVAKKYLAILDKVPFEGNFVEKYSAMLGNENAVNSDKEFASIRLTEPMHDSFENQYQQPAFLGYNAVLVEGRSINALWNSLAVCMYTKLMPAFMMRVEPLRGTTPPTTVAEALCLMSAKDPSIMQQFQGLEMHKQRLVNTLTEMQPYLKDRPKFARELFPKYKGYYPYYYFFGNLKATKKRTDNASSTAGVN